MKKSILSLIAALVICACCQASLPVSVWKDNAYRYLEDYKGNFLAGKEDATEPHFFKAKREITAGNDLTLLAIAYLTKYALHTACLEKFDTGDFARIYHQEPNPANMAYCNFLKGNFSAVDLNLLSPRYTGIIKAAAGKDTSFAAREIAAIDDSLARLIACGVWVSYMPYNEKILLTAIETASSQGWRRPLWAYLDKLQTFYLENGDKVKASGIQERLELLKKEYNN
jgi:hypothetical protein